MHSDIHQRLHALRAAELQYEARAAALTAAAGTARRRAPRGHPRAVHALRHRLGWVLVEAGLRLLRPGRPFASRVLP